MTWSPQWREGNRVVLLENGEEFFPRVFAAIQAARKEVFVETFILGYDKTGREFQAAVIAAAARGVRVELSVDGYGSADVPPDFIEAMTAAGVRYHVFDPQPKLLGVRTNLFRRLHRKIVVVDGVKAFIGGINLSHDHVREFGPEAKQDYAVEVEGPVVADIHRLATRDIAPIESWWARRWWRWRREPQPVRALPKAGPTRAALVERDNDRHRNDIEELYLGAIREARREIVIANAYFFPGYRLMRELRRAARRGVAVHLMLQGNPDKPSVRWATGTLYDYLLQAGVRIYEYCERPMHGKVAVIDDDWATVGSSNLDPLSLWLNLEANLVVRDAAFTAQLKGHLKVLLRQSCNEIHRARLGTPAPLRQALGVVAFHFLRRFPAWAGWLPAHAQQRAVVPTPPFEARADRRAA